MSEPQKPPAVLDAIATKVLAARIAWIRKHLGSGARIYVNLRDLPLVWDNPRVRSHIGNRVITAYVLTAIAQMFIQHTIQA